jgi:hypothetical protein
MEKRLESLLKDAKEVEKESKKYFQRLKRRTPKTLDLTMQALHEEEFAKTDCLTCANCCKTSSPIFTPKDIQRIAKHFRMKEVDFMTQFLERDSDDFYVCGYSLQAFGRARQQLFDLRRASKSLQ